MSSVLKWCYQCDRTFSVLPYGKFSLAPLNFLSLDDQLFCLFYGVSVITSLNSFSVVCLSPWCAGMPLTTGITSAFWNSVFPCGMSFLYCYLNASQIHILLISLPNSVIFNSIISFCSLLKFSSSLIIFTSSDWAHPCQCFQWLQF